HRQWPDHPRHYQYLRAGALHVRQQLSGRRADRLVPGDLWRLPRRRVEPARRGTAHAVPRQRRAHLSSVTRENAVDQKLYDKGMELRTAVMGKAYVERALAANQDDIGKPIQDFI